jgi:hypothetical protein
MNKPTGIEMIAVERNRQISVEGYTPEHDDNHDMGELALAAALYAIPYEAHVGSERLIKQDDFIGLHIALETGCNFFVNPEPDNMRRLVKAGALIAAELDRLIRVRDCEHEYEGFMQPGTVNGPTEYFLTCKHCGAEKTDD